MKPGCWRPDGLTGAAMFFDIFRLGLIHVAALISVAALTCRDQIVLRGLLVLSTLLYILYYFVVPEVLLWDAIFWTAVNLGVNLFVMSRLLLARTQFRLSEDERRLFAALGTLEPGEFRALMKVAIWRKTETTQILVREGAPVEKIFYVLDGRPEVSKAGRSFPIRPLAFIGEIGFLRKTPATATVTVEPGTCYVEWPAKALSALQLRRPSIKIALDGLLASDMAAKMAAV
jgi:Cyclic nucleotide-binding domain